MSTAAGAPIVVGVDGSAHQQLTLDWAVSEARLRHRPLVLVHAYDRGPVVVVVVRAPAGGGSHARQIVVGVDGSPHSAAVLDFAFREASLRRLGVTAVHAWTGPVSSGPGDMLPLVYDVDDVQAEETWLLSEALAGWPDRYPDVEVRSVVMRDRPAHALIEAAAGAELLVVGARGGGGFAGLRLGSVSRSAVHHAPCPVAVVH